MEAIAVRRSFENLGLQLLFAPIRSLVGTEGAKVSERKQQALKDLGRFFQEARSGLDLVEDRRAGGYGSLVTLEESVKAERAYGSISAILPKDSAKAKELLDSLERVRLSLLNGEPLKPEERKALHEFCKIVLDHLDQQRYRSFSGSQGVWP